MAVVWANGDVRGATFGPTVTGFPSRFLNHKTTADLRNRHPEGLHLGLVLGGGFCYSPLIVEPDYTLTA